MQAVVQELLCEHLQLGKLAAVSLSFTVLGIPIKFWVFLQRRLETVPKDANWLVSAGTSPSVLPPPGKEKNLSCQQDGRFLPSRLLPRLPHSDFPKN